MLWITLLKLSELRNSSKLVLFGVEAPYLSRKTLILSADILTTIPQLTCFLFLSKLDTILDTLSLDPGGASRRRNQQLYKPVVG